MSLIYQSDLHNNGIYGIWHVEEDDSFFMSKMSLFPIEELELSLLKSRKRTEWLTSRYLLHILSKREIRGACLKDEYGKPYLEHSENYISISHSGEFTAVIGAAKPVGIDVQVFVPKIARIVSKFINEEEWKYIPTDNSLFYFHAIWGAKESIYKAYGKRGLDFKKHMMIDTFEFDADGFFFQGTLNKDEILRKYTLFCRQIENLILVYGVEI